LLIVLFGFAALPAVILNKALSLVVVLTALPVRPTAVPLSALAPHWPVARVGRSPEPPLTLEPGPRFTVRCMSTPTDSRGLRVGELAEKVGVSADTVRYYERVGLLPRPERTAAGYRAYDEAATDRMLFIQGAQRLGLRLDDIRDLLTVRDTGQCPCEPAEQHLRRRLAELDAEMSRLAALRAEIVRMLHALPSDECLPPAPGTWCPPMERR
jgi:DNA-binding transcriptional MerR regulator